jgi:MFS transporter, PHS family, inorganic phosphate transporter
MMAAVFLMQPIGQLAAALVGLWVAIGLDHKGQDLSDNSVADSVWRYVTGVGAIPTLIALIFRLTIPETPRYTLDMENNTEKAQLEVETQYPALDLDDLELEDNISTAGSVQGDRPRAFSKQDLKQFFITEGNWIYLFGTSMCWFLLDVSPLARRSQWPS